MQIVLQISNLSQRSPIADTCYIFAIPRADSKPVISFFNRANHFSPGLPFCNFVRNTIYVIKIEMLEPVVLARYPLFHFD